MKKLPVIVWMLKVTIPLSIRFQVYSWALNRVCAIIQ
jgi:hypothetical protein